MRRILLVATLSVAALAAAPPTAATAVPPPTHVRVWNPDPALLAEHHHWHAGACGRETPACPNPGTAFLTFHRDYLDRLRDDYLAQGEDPADITPWYALPPEMKAARGWSPLLQQAEDAVLTMIDPVTRQRFASLERFGSYLQREYHNSLHGIAASVYGDGVLANADASPRSTYFFKIHSLVEWHFLRFQKGDFDSNGNSDIVAYDPTTTAVGLWLMRGTQTVTRMRIGNLWGCNWYVGATADLNYDGHVDLIWHGPGCERVSAWLMSGATHIGTVELGAVGTDWRLAGSGDFTGDMRPDLVWTSVAADVVVVWSLNGTDYTGDQVYPLPAGYRMVMPGDIDGNGVMDLLVRRFDDGYDYFVMHGGSGSPVAVTGLSRSPYMVPVAMAYYAGGDNGRLFGQTRRQADLLFLNWPPGNRAPLWTLEFSTSVTPFGTADYGNQVPFAKPPPATVQFSGPR